VIYAAVTLALLVAMAMALGRAWIGPTIYDRILALNSFGTETVLVIAVIGFLFGRPEFLDIAILYALVNFIGTIAALKFFKFGDLGRGLEYEEDDEEGAA
jgi:multicomponent Na+:H+ antiporter subunit F